jgi:hypothetical protein
MPGNLSAAMRSRTVIGLVTGAIMAQNPCSQEAAFSKAARTTVSNLPLALIHMPLGKFRL